MKAFKYLIVGGGIVAGYAAKEFVKHGDYRDGDIAIITADDAIPYERPSLSKDFLAGEEDYDDIQINNPKFYRENNIRLFLYTTVNRIDTSEKSVHTDHGDIFHYEKLLLATGSSPVKLDVPGAKSALIKYLRTLDDARAIRDQLKDSSEVIVIGGGYIGMETAASLTQNGHHVTMVFPDGALMEQFFTPELSAYFENYYRDRGISFIKGATVESFTRKSSRQISASLSNGDTLAADLAVVGIGAKPNLAFINDPSIEIDEGVRVNRRLQTSVPDVYAAGDIANYFDVTFQKRRRVEHWQNAVDTARYTVREMLGIQQDDFQSLRYFFSDVFDLSYEFWGDTEGADLVYHIGDFDEDSIGVWWVDGDRVAATFLMNRPDEEREYAQEWIKAMQPIDPDMLEQAVKVLS